ncbi:hypothetical protein CRG98_018418 [Punica granatum]|uniref:Uncharacterized protein n=1 Tax=Punica granatum TaxID=22663 RepID=A0A2I0JXX6_PUNGR|nr:hypothetical protein CRG98_018418 [Punica granatum]
MAMMLLLPLLKLRLPGGKCCLVGVHITTAALCQPLHTCSTPTVSVSHPATVSPSAMMVQEIAEGALDYNIPIIRVNGKSVASADGGPLPTGFLMDRRTLRSTDAVLVVKHATGSLTYDMIYHLVVEQGTHGTFEEFSTGSSAGPAA